MTVSEEIKQRLDIVDLIGSSGVQLRKAGRNFTGFCPFHPNARTPAFYVFPDTQSYYCFSCHKSGDAFTFVMERQGLQFGDALKELATRAGVKLPERSQETREAQEQESALHARLRQINEDAAVYWHHLLRNTARGETGRAYVAKRGLDEATVESWQLGVAPEDWSDLLRYMTDRKGYTPEELEQAGLVIRREGGGYYDRFRNRLIFPIRDLKGTIVGFGGRTLGEDHAKYMNTPETPIFHKSSLLFGLHQAREGIRRSDSVVVVEGYLDVITAHQAGFDNVVAPMGTALTAEQVQALRRLLGNEGRINLALDADAAGLRAAEKGVDSMLQTSDKQLVVRGLSLDWVADLDLPLRIIELDPGKDPDDIIRSTPERWRELIAGALPIVDFYFRAYTKGLDLGHPEHQQRALSNLAPIVAALKDFSKRAVYESRLADLLHMPFALIQASVLEVTRQARQRAPRPVGPEPARAAPASSTVDPYVHEDYLLSLIIRFPQVRDRVEATLADELQGFPDLREDLPADLRGVLERTENRLIWYAWSEHGPSGPPDVPAWIATLDPALRAHAERLVGWKDDPPLPQVSPLHEARQRAIEIARRLRQAVASRRLGEIKMMVPHTEDPADRAQLEQKLNSVLKYTGVVKAPRKSTVFQDLGTRREELG